MSKRLSSKVNHYILAILIIGGAATLCIPLANTQNYHVVSFILLFVVSILSTFMGIGPVLAASTLSALVWNFFYIPPHYTFHIEKTEDILIFGLFFILQDGNNILSSTGRLQKEKKLIPKEYNVAEWVFKNSRKAGAFTDNLSAVDYTFFPLPGTRLNPGVVAVRPNNLFLNEQKSFWDTFLSQISNALEREFLGEMAQKVRFLDESDRF